MTEQQKATRDKLTQEYFDRLIWHSAICEADFLQRLYAADFPRSLAARTLEKIKRDATKAYNA